MRLAGLCLLVLIGLLVMASPAQAVDFATKCAGAGVIACWPLDSASELFYTWPTGGPCDAAFAGQTNYGFGSARTGPGNTAANVQNGQCVFPVIDTTVKHSGAGSLKFTIGTNSDANSSGYFTEVFKRLPANQFAYVGPGSPLGSVFYFQFYQRFDPNFQSIDYQCLGGSCGGWKQMIWFGNPPNGASSGGLESTHNNGWQRDVPQMYGQQGTDDYGVEDFAGCTFAKATSLGGSGSGHASRPNYRAPLNPTCKHYLQNTWMEFTGRIEIRGASGAPTSRVQMWVDGVLVVDYGQAKVNWGGQDGDGYGQFLVTPYMTNKDAAQTHAVGFTWVDDIIVSTLPIPMVPTTPFGQLADSMTAGTWATLTTTNLTSTMADSQAISGFITDYSEDLVWDPVTRRLFFLGGGHYPVGTPVMKHVQFDEATNTWSVLPQQSWFTVGSSHAYDHLAIDPTHRYFFHRAPSQTQGHRWHIDTGVWTNMPDNTLMIYNACCIGVDYFPELNGVIWAADESGNQGGLTKLDVTTNVWSRVGTAQSYQMAPLHNYAEYNPVHHVMIFGGGNAPDDRTVWKLNASGQVTRMQDAPVSLGITQSVVTVDPISGDYLIFTTNQQFWVYKVLTDTWTLRASGAAVPIWTTGFANPIFEVIAAPVSTYGVNVFVTCDAGACRMALYKHTASGAAPTPPVSPTNLRILQ